MKTRFAPSPTGPFHIGGLRTALMVQIIAEKMHGQSILRIEDTDTARSTKEYEDNIIDSLSWSGIDFGAPCFRQSERMQRYVSLAKALVEKGYAYPCYMTAEELNEQRELIRSHNQNVKNEFKKKEKYDNRYRPENWPKGIPKEIKDKNPNPVIRLRMPEYGSTQWNDLTKGGISMPNEQLDDLIILRSDNTPTYNFCVVVDDLDLGITHVIRGEDHVSNTPKQIHIARILKEAMPQEFKQESDIVYSHIPLMFNPDGTKISKSALADQKGIDWIAQDRVVPAAVEDYVKIGILPQALVNYMLLISCQKTAELIGGEIFNRSTFVKHFDPSHMSKTSAKFDMEKLLEINFNYIKALPADDLKEKILAFTQAHDVHSYEKIKAIDLSTVAEEVKKRSKTLKQAVDVIKNIYESAEQLKSILDFGSDTAFFLEKLLRQHTEDDFKKFMNDVAAKDGKKFGDVAKEVRKEIGLTNGLPLFPVLKIQSQLIFNPVQENKTKHKFN